ncbi:alpha/beta-hydrolase [Karstenula rhodostoma CBS 690.94]|uniref:Alpha/beta-hydrolase n=1 Tax=Karstenula rhodostoma CBS 690.94 TaxID=1392251 RepID=A0A9P4UAF6_9PLEO|nr:alpha/beta-hydrolase [Karstenula rhodostoma CBS 690.94]
MSASARNIPVHKSPLVVEPTGSHKTTMIVLHGRGSTAERFAEPFLASLVSEAAASNVAERANAVFQDYFPNTKFVYPTAPLRRAVAFNRSLTHQWFDKWSPQHPELKQHLQVPGLRETSTYLHGLIQQEIDIIGAPHVALVGLSQGCASSLIATLLWRGEPFGAVVGMCGYLPFRASMVDVVDEADDEDNPFAETKGDANGVTERETEESETNTKSEKAIAWLHTELEMDKEDVHIEPPPIQSIPIFMGHGTEDPLIPCEHGRQAVEFLRAIDADIEWNEYEGLDHWYSADMLRDIIDFIKRRTGWESTTLTKSGDIIGVEDQRES